MKHMGYNAPGSDGQTYGKGGATAALGRNPNADNEVNASPCGPYSHLLGFTDDGGMDTEKTVAGGFHFK